MNYQCNQSNLQQLQIGYWGDGITDWVAVPKAMHVKSSSICRLCKAMKATFSMNLLIVVLYHVFTVDD